MEEPRDIAHVLSAAHKYVMSQSLTLAKDYTTRLPVLRAGSSGSGFDWVAVLVSGVDTSRNAWVVEAAGIHTPFERRWISHTASRLHS